MCLFTYNLFLQTLRIEWPPISNGDKVISSRSLERGIFLTIWLLNYVTGKNAGDAIKPDFSLLPPVPKWEIEEVEVEIKKV